METLTHSKRSSFKTCHRHFFHKHESRLALRREKTGRRRGSIFGSLIFAAAERFGPGRVAQPGGDDWDPVADMADLVTLIADESASHYMLFYPDSQEESDVLALEQTKVEVMALEYILRYGIDDRREIVYDLPLINPTTGYPSRRFRLGGKIDGCVVLGNRHVRIVEDKFVGQIQKAMIDRLPLDDQSSEYVSAFRQMGWTAEVAYRHTRYPGLNPTPAKEYKTKDARPAETLPEFYDRLRQDIADRPEFYFNEQLLRFPTEHLDDFARGRWGTAQEILQARRVGKTDWQKAWAMNPSRCWEWGGCEFIPLCTKIQGASDLYEVRPDNPELDTGGGVTSEYADQ